MAGAGYKLFNTGDVLTAAQVNTYLQEQAVMRFANSTARTTALSGVLAEGMMSYLDDTNSVEVYNGSAWVSVGSTGDITGVTAGTGISGGGSSGDVTITNSMATAIDAKGDLIVGTGADTFSRLAVGTNGHTLVADSTESTGLKWAAPAGGGKLLQLVSATYSTETDTASTTYADSGLTATITPSSTASKIYVQITAPFSKTAENTGNGVQYRILRGATAIATWAEASMQTGTALQMSATFGLNYLDSPSTTSATTYKLQFANTAATNRARFCSGGALATIQLLEIGA